MLNHHSLDIVQLVDRPGAHIRHGKIARDRVILKPKIRHKSAEMPKRLREEEEEEAVSSSSASSFSSTSEEHELDEEEDEVDEEEDEVDEDEDEVDEDELDKLDDAELGSLVEKGKNGRLFLQFIAVCPMFEQYVYIPEESVPAFSAAVPSFFQDGGRARILCADCNVAETSFLHTLLLKPMCTACCNKVPLVRQCEPGERGASKQRRVPPPELNRIRIMDPAKLGSRHEIDVFALEHVLGDDLSAAEINAAPKEEIVARLAQKGMTFGRGVDDDDDSCIPPVAALLPFHPDLASQPKYAGLFPEQFSRDLDERGEDQRMFQGAPVVTRYIGAHTPIDILVGATAFSRRAFKNAKSRQG